MYHTKYVVLSPLAWYTNSMTTEQMIEAIAVAYTNENTEWVRIEDIAYATGLNAGQIEVAIRELIKEDDFRAEPQPFGHRITEWDRANAPIIGGEARHLITWQ